MEVLRVFNNNVVLACDADWGEVILTGRGLGFQPKSGAQVDQAKVVRVFLPEDGRNADNFGALVAAIPPEHLALADQALQISRRDTTPVSSTTVVALADHLSFAIKRLRQGIHLEYPLRAEVAHLYPDELRTAQRVLDFVNTRAEQTLPEEEAVPIALHLVNAGFATGDLSLTYQMTGVFTQLFDVLEQAYERPFERDTVNAARFITHLHYFFVRTQTGQQLDDGGQHSQQSNPRGLPGGVRDRPQAAGSTRAAAGHPPDRRRSDILTLNVARMVEDFRLR